MPQQWRDIDDPGVWRKPKSEEPTKPTTGYDDSPPAPREPLAKEYRFKDVSIVEPAQGFEKNKPFDMEGEIEPFDKSKPISASKILLYPIGVYNGQEDKFVPGGIEADLTQETGKFHATCKSLFDPKPFADDTSKTPDATWKLYVRAEGGAAEKPMESDQLIFPKESQFVELKKEDYDEDGAKTFNKPQSGDTFKPNGVVKALQGDLIKTSFLPKDSDDGFFGDKTDKAVKEFQGYAKKTERMKRSAGKTEKTNQTLDLSQPDGIVEKKTRDEIDRWLQSDWVKPIPTLRHGEYDDTGVSKGKGKRGTDDHHEGTPVVDAQKDLQKVGVYSDAAIDGWFFDKMLDAVKLFQETAVKGEFIINGVITDIGEKLTGHSKGELCLKTQEFLKKVAEKGGKVPATLGKVKDICEKHWEAHKNDCSGFVKAVATELNVMLTGQANDIVDQIKKSPWKVLKDGKEADSEARAGKFIVAGLKDEPNGHVVIIVPGELAHEKYPTGYWGHLGSVGYKNATINYSWKSTERDKVIYASIQI